MIELTRVSPVIDEFLWKFLRSGGRFTTNKPFYFGGDPAYDPDPEIFLNGIFATVVLGQICGVSCLGGARFAVAKCSQLSVV